MSEQCSNGELAAILETAGVRVDDEVLARVGPYVEGLRGWRERNRAVVVGESVPSTSVDPRD